MFKSKELSNVVFFFKFLKAFIKMTSFWLFYNLVSKICFRFCYCLEVSLKRDFIKCLIEINMSEKKEGRGNLGTPSSADLIATSCHLDSSFKIIIVEKTFWKIAKCGFFKSIDSWLCKRFWISKWFYYFLFRSFSSYRRFKTM